MNIWETDHVMWPLKHRGFQGVRFLQKIVGNVVGCIAVGTVDDVPKYYWHDLPGKIGELNSETMAEDPLLFRQWNALLKCVKRLNKEYNRSEGLSTSMGDPLLVMRSVWHPAAWKHPDHYFEQKPGKRYQEMWNQVAGHPRA